MALAGFALAVFLLARASYSPHLPIYVWNGSANTIVLDLGDGNKRWDGRPIPPHTESKAFDSSNGFGEGDLITFRDARTGESREKRKLSKGELDRADHSDRIVFVYPRQTPP